VRVERQPGDLDGHLGLGRFAVLVVVVVVLELVVEVLVVRRHRAAT
jgi:hypothetical protein